MIQWPAGFAPDVADLHAHNELVTDATPEAIWPWLLRAGRWHELYSNCHHLRFVGEPGPDVGPRSRFTWWTFGVPVATTIEEFVPGERLSWSGHGLGARGHHAWWLERVDGGTRFVTEETQVGLVPRALRLGLRPGLLHFHQRWLEGLVHAARLGHPDRVPSLRRITR